MLRYILFISLTVSFLTACQNDSGILDDTLYVRYKDAEMPAYIHGNSNDKIFIIYLHGGPGGNGIEYRTEVMINKIEPHYAVVYWDQRHAGMSQGNFSPEDFTINLMTEDVMALVEVIKFKYGEDSKFFLMGHSWGGALGVATLVTENNQNSFKGWIEIDGAHDLGDAYFENIRFMKSIAEEQLSLGNSVDFWSGVTDTLSLADTTRFDADVDWYINSTAFEAEGYLLNDGVLSDYDFTLGGLLNEMIAAGFKNNPITTKLNGNIGNYYLEETGIWDVLSYTDEIALIDIPCLFMWGKYDMVVPTTLGQKAYNLCTASDKEFVLFEESGHSPMNHETEKFANTIINFIERNK